MSLDPRLNLHIFLTHALHESRFLKQAHSIAETLGNNVVLAAKWAAGLDEKTVLDPRITIWRVRIRTLTLPRFVIFQLVKAIEWCLHIVRYARRNRPARIHCHSLASLPVGVVAKRFTGAKLIFDAHELETERVGLHGARQWLDRRIERHLIRHCDAVICVSDAIADWYAERYGIARPTVVRNIPDIRTQEDLAGSQVLRVRLGLAADDLLFIYVGGLSHGRRIEQYLRVFARASSNRHLVFMGYGELEDKIREAAAQYPNIHFHPAVAPHEVLRYTASADVGLVGVENVCLSYYYALPNKIFEYLLAGLPAVAGKWPELERVVSGYDCGWLHDEDDDALLRVVEEIDREAIEKRRAGVEEARQAFSWENEENALVQLYRDLTPA